METFDFNKGSSLTKEVKDAFRSNSFSRRSRHRLLVLIFALIVIAINPLLQKPSNLPALFSLTQIGFETSEVDHVSLRDYGRKGWIYQLELSSAKTGESTFQMSIELYDTDNSEVASDLIEMLMMEKKKTEQRYLSNCGNKCLVISDGLTEPASQYMKSVNLNEDMLVYLLYDPDQIPEKRYYQNMIFMQKDNKVLQVTVPVSYHFDSDVLHELSALMNETELFKEARKNKNAE